MDANQGQDGVVRERWMLEIVQGNASGREFELSGETLVIGRDGACEIAVDDQNASRRHARLTRAGDAYAIEDLGSRNRTLVNGKCATGNVTLNEGDRIAIGSTRFVLRRQATKITTRAGADAKIRHSIDACAVAASTSLVTAEVKLQAILKITDALGATLDLEAVLSKMLDGLLEIFRHADRALVLLLEGDRLVPKAAKHRRGVLQEAEYSTTIVRQAIDSREAIVSTDVAADQRLPVTRSLSEYGIRSIMCVPLLSQAMGVLGVIQLDAQSVGAQFDAEDVAILASVARQASISVEYAQLHKERLKQAWLQKEMDVAQEVQHHFLPKVPALSAGYRFWAYYSAAGKVGGDYYDFVPLPNGNRAVLLGDVAGKGIPAALMMAKLSSVCKVALLSQPNRVADAMAAINNEVCEMSVNSAFVTLVLCVIDPLRHEIIMARAGHMSPLVCRADGRIDAPATDVRGFPLGIFRDAEFGTAAITLAPGETVLLYSDGISEAMNADGTLYGDQQITRQLTGQGQWSKPPAEVGTGLVEDVRRHIGACEQNDDISLLVFQRA